MQCKNNVLPPTELLSSIIKLNTTNS